MSRVIVFLVAVALMLAAVAGVSHESKKPAASMKYFCATDKVGSAKAGACPICKTNMTKASAYICPKCDMTSAKAGKCPCGATFVKTASLATKHCKGCGYFYNAKAKTCPVCAAKAKNKIHA